MRHIRQKPPFINRGIHFSWSFECICRVTGLTPHISLQVARRPPGSWTLDTFVDQFQQTSWVRLWFRAALTRGASYNSRDDRTQRELWRKGQEQIVSSVTQSFNEQQLASFLWNLMAKRDAALKGQNLRCGSYMVLLLDVCVLGELRRWWMNWNTLNCTF